ncbi:MAG: T9SS type A sorting domain-containing protein, partial [Ignavibacteria bacterium]
AGIWAIDVVAIVPSGQQWRVGSSNLRYNFTSTPTGAATIHPDASVSGANVNLNSGNYSNMTTTSISGGTAISLNIARLGNCFLMTPGTYLLGRIRFNRIDTTGCITLNMRTTVSGFSVVQDSITQWLAPADFDSLATVPPGCIRLDFLTGMSGENELPTVFKLYNNYPNPFNPSTMIKYDVPQNSFVKLSVYDILGKLVTNLVNRDMSAGRYEIVWDAKNYASGTYIYKLETSNFSDVKKMMLIK